MKTIHWFIEDCRQAAYWEKVLPAYTHWFAIQKEPIKSHCQQNDVAFGYLPTATGIIPSQTLTSWEDRSFDLAFIGVPSPYRIEVLEALSESGISMSLGGSGWENYSGPLRAKIGTSGWLDSSAVHGRLFQGRIGLHIPFEEPLDRYLCHVSPRLYEVLACGGKLLCEDAPLYREALRDFSVGYFRGPKEAVELVRGQLAQSLSHQDQNSQQNLVTLRHDYGSRFREMVERTR